MLPYVALCVPKFLFNKSKILKWLVDRRADGKKRESNSSTVYKQIISNISTIVQSIKEIYENV